MNFTRLKLVSSPTRMAANQPWSSSAKSNYRLSKAEWNVETETLTAWVNARTPTLWNFADSPATTVSIHVTGTPIAPSGIRTVEKVQRVQVPSTCVHLDLEIEPGTAAAVVVESRLGSALRITVAAQRDRPRPRLELGASGAITSCEVRDCNLTIVQGSVEGGEQPTPLFLSRMLCQDGGLDYRVGHVARLELSGTCDVKLADSKKTSVTAEPGSAIRLVCEELKSLGIGNHAIGRSGNAVASPSDRNHAAACSTSKMFGLLSSRPQS